MSRESESMKTSARKYKRHAARHSMAALTAAFFATLLGLPSHAALTIPPVPLQVGTPLAPNIMLILDDSGSMEWDFMPGAFNSSSVPSVSPENIKLKAYSRNTMYYNPNVEYDPWQTADGGFVTGGTSLDSVWGDDETATDEDDISGETHTYYVPKSDSVDLSETASYFRYQIRTDGSVYRSEYGTSDEYPEPERTVLLSETISADNKASKRYQVTVPAGASGLRFLTWGGNGDADLYVEFGEWPDRDNGDDCHETWNGNNHSCTFNDPNQGVYYIDVRADNWFNGVNILVDYGRDGHGCETGNDTGWRNCIAATPTDRTPEAEAENFATWYSYYRTRLKAAKGGASAAFSDLAGANYRVGFTTIWGPNQASQNEEFLINVGSNNGLFEDEGNSTNRTTWFTRLHAARANNGTPLKDALDRMGRYYSDELRGRSGTNGPYGPEASPLECRQNFSILTTDGYWNSNDVNVGNQDGAAGEYAKKPGETGQGTLTYTPSAPYEASASNTLADVAMKYWKTDLMPDMANIVPSSTPNPAFWQHMVTFGISLGLQGTLPQKTVADVLRDGANGFAWPNPNDDEDNERIDDLLHAAVNGHGAFAAASNPEEFTNALRSALASIDERTSSGSNISFNSFSISANTRTYAASFVAGRWVGEVAAYSLDDDGVVDPPVWLASEGIPTTGRNVLTYGGLDGGTAVPDSFPTTDQLAVLTQDIADYIVGNRDGEGTTYRTRTHLFGDIVNSSPVYVAEGTTETIYVGANDGMLHAINAANGQERFTYIPGILDMAKLPALARRNDFVHEYFVDGPIVVSTRAQTPGKNYLVGTLGRGGRGIYGLDVTDPTTFANSGSSWEFAGDDDMGMVLGKPQIARVNVGTGGTMAAIVSNGINSVNETAALFVIDLETGALIAKIDTNADTENGLSVPTGVDSDGNGTVDFVYAGDMNGNVWKFDLTSTDENAWDVSRLFTATVSGDATLRQPITGGITLAYNPATFAPWVFFGTGRYIEETDPTDMSVQSWYGIEDNGTPIAGRAALKEREMVLAGTIDGQPVRAFEQAAVGDMASFPGWVVDLETPPPPGTAAGERMIGDQFVVAGNVLVASSIIPGSTGCATDGSGFFNFIDAFTGGAVGSPFVDANGDGKFDDSDSLPSDTNGDGDDDTHTPIGSIDTGIGMPTDLATLIGGGGAGQFCGMGSAGKPGCIPFKWGPGFGRVSWREILKD